MRTRQQYQIYLSALELENFTTKELAVHSGASYAAVNKELSRNAAFFEEVGRERTGQRGTQAVRWTVQSEQRPVLRTKLASIYARSPEDVGVYDEGADSLLAAVGNMLDTLEAGQIKRSYRESAFALCRSKLAAANTIKARLAPPKWMLVEEKLQALRERLDNFFLPPKILPEPVPGFTKWRRVVAAQQGMGHLNYFIFDCIPENDRITEAAISALRDPNANVYCAEIENVSTPSANIEIQIESYLSNLLRETHQNAAVAFLTTVDSHHRSWLVESIIGAIINTSKLFGRFPDLPPVVLDQSRNFEIEAKVQEAGGNYIADTDQKDIPILMQTRI